MGFAGDSFNIQVFVEATKSTKVSVVTSTLREMHLQKSVDLLLMLLPHVGM